MIWPAKKTNDPLSVARSTTGNTMKLSRRPFRSLFLFRYVASVPSFAVALCISALLISCNAPPRNFLRTEGSRILDARGDTVLLRGMGLGGWMLQEGYMFRLGFMGPQYRIRDSISALIGEAETARFYERWLNNHTRKADIDSLAAWGFNSIRLPMHYQLYTLPVADEPVAGQQTWQEKGFALTDSLLAWCRANRMYLILDLHAAPGGQGNDLNIADRDPDEPSLWESEANRQKTIDLWRKLAARYAGEEWIGGYDILNETNWGFEDPADKHGISETRNAPLRKLLVDITRAIREVDTNHIIFLEGNGFANNYSSIFPLWDDNLVLSFHKYGNFNTRESIRRFLDLRRQYDVPLWLGESGENSNTWFTEAIELCEKHGIGWAWWPGKKMGISNPLEIKAPRDYQQLLAYWQGKGKKPTQEKTLRILNEWIENLRVENNIIHHDVMDAMFRQVRSYEALPFREHSVRAGTRIAAVDFDLGRQRTAYFDNDSANYRYTPGVRTTGNRGGSYRNDGVDIRADENGHHIFHIEDGEWLQYTVNVQEEGIDQLQLLVASGPGAPGPKAANNTDAQNTGTPDIHASVPAPGQVTVRIDDHTLTNPVAIPFSGSDTSWQMVPVNIPMLATGKAVIRVQVGKGGFTFKSILFSRQRNTPGQTSAAVSGPPGFAGNQSDDLAVGHRATGLCFISFTCIFLGIDINRSLNITPYFDDS